MVRSRNFCFTINNWHPKHEEMLALLEVKYIVYGKEVGASGTPHLQGFISFHSAKTLKSVIKKLPGAHIEVAKGTAYQAAVYCKKDGEYIERGIAPVSKQEQGKQGAAKYEEAWQLAKQGRIDEIPSGLRLRYYKTLIQISNDYRPTPPSNQVLDNKWFYGPSGTGKSRKARELFPDAYIKNTNKWWDNYQGEATVIIEEWAPTHECLASYLKIWSDHYPFRAEVKGSSMMARPIRIVVTSNYSISECFTHEADSSPLERRFQVIEFGHRGAYMELGKLQNSQ